MATVQYRRVSSVGQNLDRQEVGEDVDKAFEDKVSGKTTDRPGLDAALAYVREGDVLRVHSVDRLARSLSDLLGLVKGLTDRGVTVQFVKEGLTLSAESRDPFASCMLSVIGAFAEFEVAISSARQAEGIALAKERGAYSGHGQKPALSAEEVTQVRELHALGVRQADLARRFKVAKATMQHVLHETGAYA